jgi:hypothetical protein
LAEGGVAGGGMTGLSAKFTPLQKFVQFCFCVEAFVVMVIDQANNQCSGFA